MAGIADIVVIFRCTGQRERVVPPDGILHHLNQRQKILIKVFRMQPRHGIGMAHQRARSGHIQRVFNAFVQLAGRKALKITALAAIYIDDLNVIARFYKVGLCRGRFHPQIQHRVSQRIRQIMPGHLHKRGPLHCHHQGRRGILRAGVHRMAGGRDNHHAVARDHKELFIPGRGLPIKQCHSTRLCQINSAPFHAKTQATQAAAHIAR